jgi:hypothetical protein
MGLFGAIGDSIGSFLGHKAQKKQTKNILLDYNGAETGALNAFSGARDASIAGYTGARDATLGYYQPYQQTGVNALNRANDMQSGGFQYSPTDPSYAWRLGQGVDAIDRSAAARGQILSGGNLKALTRYGQGLASTEFANDFARNNQLAQLGLSGTNGAAQAQQNYATGLANTQSGYATGTANTLFGAADGRTGARYNRGNAIAAQYGDVFSAGGDNASQALLAFFGG